MARAGTAVPTVYLDTATNATSRIAPTACHSGVERRVPWTKSSAGQSQRPYFQHFATFPQALSVGRPLKQRGRRAPSVNTSVFPPMLMDPSRPTPIVTLPTEPLLSPLFPKRSPSPRGSMHSHDSSHSASFILPGHDHPPALSQEQETLVSKLVDVGHDHAAANLAVVSNPALGFDALSTYLAKRSVKKEPLPDASRLSVDEPEPISRRWSPLHHRPSSIHSQDSMASPKTPTSGYFQPPRRISIPPFQPPNSRTAPLPPSILKTNTPPNGVSKHARNSGTLSAVTNLAGSLRMSLWQKPREWFAVSKYTPPNGSSALLNVNGTMVRRGRSNSPTPPPSPKLSLNSVESEDMPQRALKRVRFPVVELTQEYRFSSSNNNSTTNVQEEPAKAKAGNNAQAWMTLLASRDMDDEDEVEDAVHTTHVTFSPPITKQMDEIQMVDIGTIADMTQLETPDALYEQHYVYTAREIASYYLDACHAREEKPLASLRKQLERAAMTSTYLRSLDVSSMTMDLHAADALSDLLGLDCGLRQLRLDQCKLDDESLKVLLHSLLLVDQLEELSLQGNRTLRCNGFKYAAIYMKKSMSLRCIDLSHTCPDKKSIKYLAHAISTNSGQLSAVYLNACNIKSQMLEILIPAIKRSNLLELSLAKNGFGTLGAVILGSLLRTSDVYQGDNDSIFGEVLHTEPLQYDDDNNEKESKIIVLPRLPRSSSLPRTKPFAKLERLDVSDNDIASGAQYIAQALRKNKLLKELILSGNQLDSYMLSMIAEALTVNHGLEVLDLSNNPLTTPNPEGISDLQIALTVNTTLRTIHLANTQLTTDHAITLAELLPETATLSRLDVSHNPGVGVAGVLALAVSLKMNTSLLCLDHDVVTDDAEMNAYSHDIVSSCIRNAELQQEEQVERQLASVL